MRANLDEPITGINVTPLVDVTLVLLIIFMVTARTVVAQTLPIDLRKETHTSEQQTLFVVTVDVEGRVLANGAPARDDEALRSAAMAALAGDAGVRAVIQASRQVPHGAVIHVLDQLRRAGMEKVGFASPRPVAQAEHPDPKP